MSTAENEAYIRSCYMQLRESYVQLKADRSNLNGELEYLQERVVETLEEVKGFLVTHAKNEYREPAVPVENAS